MRFPAYGRALLERRLAGERPRVVALLVGADWRRPRWLPAEIPHLAVKPAPWHLPIVAARGARELVDWSVVRGMTVLALDARAADEIEEGPDRWDSWLWLLAAVQEQARDVWMFTPTIEFTDSPSAWAIERDLSLYAYLGRSIEGRTWRWPVWWPCEERLHERAA